MADTKQQYLSKENLDTFGEMIGQALKEKLDAKADAGSVAEIDDDNLSTETVWSSEKTNFEIQAVDDKIGDIIDDETKGDASTYSSGMIEDRLGMKVDKLTDTSDSYATTKSVSNTLTNYYTKTAADTVFATNSRVDDVVSQMSKLSAMPVGTIALWSTDKAPDGWLMCDDGEGNPVVALIKDYQNLFDVIGTTYGYKTEDIDFGLPCVPVVQVPIDTKTIDLHYIIKY